MIIPSDTTVALESPERYGNLPDPTQPTAVNLEQAPLSP
jgi:hypothetical protein